MASARSKLVKALDDAFREWVLKNLGRRCVLCGRKANLAAHLISRSKHSVRWNPLNVTPQDRGCNLRHEFYPEAYTSWWIKRHGEQAYFDLVEASQFSPKFKTKQLEDLLAIYGQ